MSCSRSVSSLLSFICRSLFISCSCISLFFFFNDTATTEIYTLSLHDALPISRSSGVHGAGRSERRRGVGDRGPASERSEEHTSELQSHSDLVCRLLLEKKKKTKIRAATNSTQVTRSAYILSQSTHRAIRIAWI